MKSAVVELSNLRRVRQRCFYELISYSLPNSFALDFSIGACSRLMACQVYDCHQFHHDIINREMVCYNLMYLGILFFLCRKKEKVLKLLMIHCFDAAMEFFVSGKHQLHYLCGSQMLFEAGKNRWLSSAMYQLILESILLKWSSGFVGNKLKDLIKPW